MRLGRCSICLQDGIINSGGFCPPCFVEVCKHPYPPNIPVADRPAYAYQVGWYQGLIVGSLFGGCLVFVACLICVRLIY